MRGLDASRRRSGDTASVTRRPSGFATHSTTGANTPWASNEETDFLIRLLKQEANIIKLKDLAIAHHSLQGSPTKSLKYGMGRFEVIMKNKLGARIYLINLLQPIVRYIKRPKPHNLLLCISTMIGRSGIINITYKLLNHSH